jgi:hypothetical protein
VGGIGLGRRLLLLSYHFPPSTTTGALRWEKLARFAAARGYGLDVVGLAPESLESRDDTRLAALPKGTTFIGVPEDEGHWSERAEQAAWTLLRGRPRAPSGGSEDRAPVGSTRPGSVAPEDIRWSVRPRDLLRAWWAWKHWARDARWARAATLQAERLIRPGVHRAIITSGPPHRVHRDGGRLATRAGLPHVMDLRDPWSLPRRMPEHVASPLAFRLAARAERRAVHGAALVVLNTASLHRAMATAYPKAADRLLTVMNGWDEDSIPSRARVGGHFSVVHAGSVYLDRSPATFLAAARQVIDRLQLTPAEFRIEFLGPAPEGAATINRDAANRDMSAFVHVLPRKLRVDALAHLAGATMLLNLAQDSAYAIPSKVFEYLQFNAWVLALANPGTPTHDVLLNTGVDLASPADIPAIAGQLGRRIESYRRGERPGPIAGRDRLSRASQAAVLFDALEKVVA